MISTSKHAVYELYIVSYLIEIPLSNLLQKKFLARLQYDVRGYYVQL